MVVMEKYGADSIRFYLASSAVMQAENLSFSEKGVQEVLRKNIMILWNVYKLYQMFAEEFSANKPKEDSTKTKTNSNSGNVLDHWILVKLKLLVDECTDGLEKYDLPRALRPITVFIDELSTWYLRRSRSRFKSDDLDDKQKALETTKYVLTTLTKLMAPFTPFIAETIWQKVNGLNFEDKTRSVHLESWPDGSSWTSAFFNKALKIIGHNPDNQKVLDNMAVARKIAEAGLASRDEAGIKIRQMLSSLEVQGLTPLDPKYIDLVTDELNIKKLIFTDFKNEKLTVKLDTVLTPELKKEGLKREFIRAINQWRKQNNLNINDKITICYQVPSELQETLETISPDIIQETLASDFSKTETLLDDNYQKELKFESQSIFLSIKKV
jgi:isoleucyl-tRNA synthetase